MDIIWSFGYTPLLGKPRNTPEWIRYPENPKLIFQHFYPSPSATWLFFQYPNQTRSILKKKKQTCSGSSLPWERIFMNIGIIIETCLFLNVLFPYGHCPKGGGVKACHGLEHFFSKVCPGVQGLAGMFWNTFFPYLPAWQRGEGGLKLFGQCLYGNNTFQKWVSLTHSRD